MVRNSQEKLFLLFSLYLRTSQAHIPLPTWGGAGVGGAHFISGSLAIHFKRCFVNQAVCVLYQELFTPVLLVLYSLSCFPRGPCLRAGLIFLLHCFQSSCFISFHWLTSLFPSTSISAWNHCLTYSWRNVTLFLYSLVTTFVVNVLCHLLFL